MTEEAAKDAAKKAGFEKSVKTVKTSFKANSKVCICQSEVKSLRCQGWQAALKAGNAKLSRGGCQGRS